MSQSLFILNKGAGITKMPQVAFGSEDEFQALLASFPELLTDADFGEQGARRWVLVGREVAIPNQEGGAAQWSVDHVYLDQDGVLTLVEVKRASDTRARRQVVAQILEYAANATNFWRVADISKLFEATCNQSGTLADIELAKLLQSDSPNLEGFWQVVRSNLGSGRIRLIIVADAISAELARIVEYLNDQLTQASILALELKPYYDGANRVLVPRLIGASSRATASKSATQTLSVANLDEWLSLIFTPGASSAEQLKKFLDLTSAWGAKIDFVGQSIVVDFRVSAEYMRVLYVRADGRVAISGYMLAKIPGFESDQARLAFFDKFRDAVLDLPKAKPTSEPAFLLPALDNSDAWSRLDLFFLTFAKQIQEVVAPVDTLSGKP
ncbi:hypothetical protein [Rhodopseudomonas sp. BR0M22]|uniref:hypothetical protein n=1 Tax=Rhodopseudomonas sp. BR0M22 TaxID=2269369 RepID=UPI0013E081F5|nr:hypothetical protein [Rhodopseudomonas sp. BR0M22]NEW94896.1 hypothetical protein [Rhodopseudomonas sp. BR0M22]